MGKNEIWVICIDIQHELTSALQLINKAHELSNIKKVSNVAVCIGKNEEALFKLITENGADYILAAQYQGNDEIELAEILKQLIKEHKPEMIMFQGNCLGKYLAAVCSTAFQAGLTADCIDISLADDGDYIFSRAALNNSVIANIRAINSDIKMCTVKKNSFPFRGYLYDKECKVVHFDYDIIQKKSKLEVLERVKKITIEDNLDWQNAKIVFAIGRGVTNKTYLGYIYDLARRYNAIVVGTRAAVETGMVVEKRQVGQSGYSISPDIYISFGVSGACQHIVGIKNARRIIAINKDEKAPMFEYADFKIINSVESIVDEWMRFCGLDIN